MLIVNYEANGLILALILRLRLTYNQFIVTTPIPFTKNVPFKVLG